MIVSMWSAIPGWNGLNDSRGYESVTLGIATLILT